MITRFLPDSRPGVPPGPFSGGRAFECWPTDGWLADSWPTDDWLAERWRRLASLLLLLSLLTGLGAVQAQSSQVYSPAFCTVTLSPTSPTTQSSVTASVTSNLGSGSYTLDWGDGTRSSFNPATTGNVAKPGPYLTSGTFNVTVSDTSVICRTSVVVTQAPITFTVTPASGLVGDVFTAQITGLPYTSYYTLNWGDNTPVVQVTAQGSSSYTHRYAAPGIFRVTFGNPNSTSPQVQVVTVTAPTPPTLNVSPQTVTLGGPVTATTTNTAAGDTLDWGDSSPPVAAAPSQTHTYAAAGTFTMRLLRGTAPLAVQAVTVTTPTPTLSVAPGSANVGQSFNATLGNLVTGVTYSLDWADGTVEPVTGSGTTTKTHVYAAAGTFAVKLSAPSVAPVVQTVTVTLPAPTLSVAPASATPGQTVTATLGTLVTGVAYSLDWADGTIDPVTGSGTATRTHAYAAPGTYAVKLSASGVAPAVQTVSVGYPAPTLDVAPNPALVGQSVTATVGNPNPALSLDWGDGSVVQAAASQSHSYAAPGRYTVRLLQGGSPRTDVAPLLLSVNAPAPTLTVAPPAANLGQTFTATLGNLVTGVTYNLGWADGTVDPVTGSGTATRTHVYAAAGTFAVRLTAPGLAPALQTVTVNLAPIVLNVVPSAISPGDDVTANISGAAKSVVYLLDWGDASAPQRLAGDDAYAVRHVYTQPGIFVVKVTSGGAPQGTATVTVNAAIPGLDVSPTLGLVGQTVLAKPSNTRSGQTYTLDWGDGSAPLVFTGNTPVGLAGSVGHAYAQAGTFQVRLTTPGVPPVVVPVVITYGCVIEQNGGLVQAGLPSTFTLGGQPATGVNIGRVGFPAGTPYTFDWGDGSAPQSGSAASAPFTLTHTFAGVGPVVLKVVIAGQTVCTLALNVEVPPATLSVDAQRATTPSIISLTGLISGPALNYTLDFGDGTPPQPVSAAQPNVPHVYAQAGSYPVKLNLLSADANKPGSQISRTLAVGVALVPAAVGTLQVQTEVRFADKPGQPVGASGVLAPAPVQLPQNVLANSVVSLTAQGGGSFTVRWSWTPVSTANVSAPPQAQILDTRTVTLAAGSNTLTLPLTTNVPGIYILKIELLGDPSNLAISVPQIALQTVNIVAVPPTALLVGPPGNQFRFKVGKLILKDGGHPEAPTAFDPANFWAELTLDSPLVIGSIPIPLTVAPSERLKISVDGETATLLSGTVFGRTTPGVVTTKAVSGTKAESGNPSFALPALAPMQLKVGKVSFDSKGAELLDAIVTSPDYTQTNVGDWLKSLLGKWLQEKAGGAKPSTPGDIKKSLIDPIFDPFENWAPDPGGPGASPILVPVIGQQFGGQRRTSTSLLASGRPLAGQEPYASLTATAILKPLNLTSTGNGYGVVKPGAGALLDSVAKLGVKLDYGVNDKAGKPLTDGAVLSTQVSGVQTSGLQTFNPQKNGHFDMAGLLGGPIDVAALQNILGSGQHDFLDFPELFLNVQGGLVSAKVVGGVNAVSLPTSVGYAGGDQKLGSDSGVSMHVDTKPVIYLDLDPNVSVQPQGYVSGSNKDQASLLRQTYSGAPALVKVPDVGPAWQGLLWISNSLTVTGVLDSGKKTAAGAVTPDFSLNLKVAAPVSFGLGGWNFNIDADTTSQGGDLVGGWPYSSTHIAASMVKSNLIRSVRSGAFGPLAFVGGLVNATVDGSTVTIEDTGLSRAFGPDGSFTATHVTYSQEGAGNSAVGVFTLSGAVFDLKRIGAGLGLKCSALLLTPNLSNLNKSVCTYNGANGQRTVAGTRMNVTGISLAGVSGNQGALKFSGDVLVGDTNGAPITAAGADLTLAADPNDYSLVLNTPAIGDFGVQNGSENGLKLSLPAGKNNLKGTGIAGIGAGLAAEANHELSFDTGSLVVGDSITMQVRGTFGRQANQSYWYVLANGKVNPCLSVLEVLNVCELYGGLAYNMSWNGGQAGTVQFNSLNTRPVRGNTGLQLAAGVVGNIIDDKTVNVKGIVLISPAQYSLDFGGDVYLLKAVGGKANGRFAGTLSTQGFILNACVGPVAFSAPGGGMLNCSDLDRLTLAKVLYIQGGAKIAIGYGGHKYFYLGTYKQPIQADVDLKIAKFTVTGYVMTGDLPTGGDALPPIPGLQPGFGVAAGAAIDYTYHLDGSRSVLICTAKWHFDAHLYAAVDAVMTISPPQLGGHMALGASASVGGSLCGIGASVGAGIALDATFLLTPDTGRVDGTAHVDISLPVVKDVHGDFDVHVKVY